MEVANGGEGPREAHRQDSPDVSGQSELEQLGYKQELKRALSLFGNLALVVAGITPATSLLVIGPVALGAAGTGAFLAYLLAGVIALCMALCFAELGSVYPTTGGLYVIVTRVLGRQVGFLAALNVVAQTIFIPASIALGFGPYLSALVPGVSPNLASFVVVVIATGLALLSISENSWITTVAVTLELALLSALIITGILGAHRSPAALFEPISFSGSGMQTAVGFALIFSAVTTGLFSYNGYDGSITFSEETRGEAREIGRGVLISALVAVFFELVPLGAMILAAPDLGKFLGAKAPFVYAVNSAVGSTGGTFITLGILVAIFAAVLAIILFSARILYSTGRDRAWPGRVNGALTHVSSRYGSPWVAVLIIGGLAAVLTFFSNVVLVITFTGVSIVFNYALVAIAALVSRTRRPGLARPWRMPLWPLPPVVALVGAAVAVSQQKPLDLLIVAGIVIAGLAYYAFFLRPRSTTHWRHPSGHPVEESSSETPNDQP